MPIFDANFRSTQVAPAAVDGLGPFARSRASRCERLRRGLFVTRGNVSPLCHKLCTTSANTSGLKALLCDIYLIVKTLAHEHFEKTHARIRHVRKHEWREGFAMEKCWCAKAQ